VIVGRVWVFEHDNNNPWLQKFCQVPRQQSVAEMKAGGSDQPPCPRTYHEAHSKMATTQFKDNAYCITGWKPGEDTELQFEFARIGQWDHHLELEKIGDVSQMKIAIERHEEQSKCCWWCMMCHREKGYLSGDFIGFRYDWEHWLAEGYVIRDDISTRQ